MSFKEEHPEDKEGKPETACNAYFSHITATLNVLEAATKESSNDILRQNYKLENVNFE